MAKTKKNLLSNKKNKQHKFMKGGASFSARPSGASSFSGAIPSGRPSGRPSASASVSASSSKQPNM